MIRFDNDRVGFEWAAQQAAKYIESRQGDAESLLDQANALAAEQGPYAFPGAGAGWRARLKAFPIQIANRLLWRQHAFNARSVAILRDLALREIRREQGWPVEGANKPLLVWLVPYDLSNPVSGGAVRITGLARRLARIARIRFISLVGPTQDLSRISLYPDVEQVGVPMTRAFLDAAKPLEADLASGARLVALAEHHRLIPELRRQLAEARRDARVVAMNVPEFLPAVREAGVQCPLIYEAHDVHEHFLAVLAGRERLPEGPGAVARALERKLCEEAALVVAVSEEDRALFIEPSGAAASRVVIAPNGVDVAHAHFAPPSASAPWRARHGLGQPVVLFVGALLRSNMDAARFLAREVAPGMPDTQFVHLGATAQDVLDDPHAAPVNMLFTGRIPAHIKEGVFALADIAVSPLRTGSGASLKIPDYLAHGKRVLTTPVGLRGFDHLRAHVRVAERTDFTAALRSLIDDVRRDPAAADRAASEARQAVEQTLDWSVAAAPFVDRAAALLGASL